MKTQNITLRAVSVLLCVLLFCSLIPPVYAAGESSAITGAEMEVGSARVQVSYTAAVDAVAVAALYDGSTGKMRAVGTENADAGSGTFPVYLPETRQEGDQLRVFLLERDSSSPLAQNWTEKNHFGNVQVGSCISFGRYEQDNDLTNGKEPISWRVLAVENGKALLISEYALDCKKFNETYSDVTWETCTIRQWLNKDFYNVAFNSEEKASIATTTVVNEDNPICGADGGNTTQDKIFLLSFGEAQEYFVNDDGSHDFGKESHDRACKPTAYAIAQGCWAYDDPDKWHDGFCWWWLRSPGWGQDHAAGVDRDGDLHGDGFGVHYGDAAVRPAFWINLNS